MVALLLASTGSVDVLATVAVLLIDLRPPERTFTTSWIVDVAPGPSVPTEQITVPVLPTAGVVHAAFVELEILAKVVVDGMTSRTVTPVALPELTFFTVMV